MTELEEVQKKVLTNNLEKVYSLNLRLLFYN